MWRISRQTPETALKRAVKQVLAYNGWFAFPVLQGLGAYRGIPDIIAIKQGEVLFIEIKSPRGKQNEYQQEFERQVTAKGGKYLVVRDIDEFLNNISPNARK